MKDQLKASLLSPSFLSWFICLSGFYCREYAPPHCMVTSPWNDKKECSHIQKCSSLKDRLWLVKAHFELYFGWPSESMCVSLSRTMASLIPEAHDALRRMYGHSSQKPRQASFVWKNMHALFLYTEEGFVNFYIIQKYTAESQEFPKWTCKNILNQRGKNINLAE